MLDLPSMPEMDESMSNAHTDRKPYKVIADLIRTALVVLVLSFAGSVRAETTLLRTTLIVSNVEASIAWYRHLGFEVAETLGGPRNPQSSFPLAAHASTFRLIILAGANEKGGRIGLLEFADEAPPVVAAGSAPVGVGSHVLVVEVPDARAIFARLRVQGAAPLTEEPTLLRRISAEGQEMIGYVFHVYDPDGTLVEIMQPPSPKD